jgi:predicted nucleotidyltransferase
LKYLTLSKYLHYRLVDLQTPLRSIAPGLDSAVLHVLAGTESGLSASQISRLAHRGTRVGQLPVLNRLVEHGLVVAEPANRGFLYRLNRQHVLAEPVLAITQARATILQRLAAEVGAMQPAPLHASVFGSFARGEAGPESDIDVLIITTAGTEPSDEWSHQLQDVGDRVLAWSGNRMKHVVLSVDV